VERPLRLIERSDPERLARICEALLVVASTPLSAEELAAAAGDDATGVADALALLGERYCEGRSGIVLEHVAGGYAFRAASEAAEACACLFERPAGRGLTQAALETLAIIAYLGPCTRPEIARIRGVNVDGVVAGLLERGMLVEDGRDELLGAVRYRTTPLFERVFGLVSLAELPRIDDLDSDAQALRERLETIAERRGA
jgi:segregation and condensation protein B